MKTIIKTIGCIGISFALWHTSKSQAITLEQINAYLTNCRNKSIQNLEALLEQEEKRPDSDIKAANTKYILEFLKNYSNKKNVYYDGNGDFVLETVNCSGTVLSKFFPCFSYEKQKRDGGHTNQKINALDAVSEELSANALKQRGFDTEEMTKSGINKVREITFDSILKSSFFTEEQRRKGEAWFHDLDALKIAVENYAEHCVSFYKKHGQYKISLENTYIYTNNKGRVQTLTVSIHDVFTSDFLFVPVSGNEAVTLKQKTKSALERMLHHKNGKEKVILFLLLDEMTLPEARCIWVWRDRDGRSCAFSRICNTFLCNPDDIEWAISHEIGHYLQAHLGLKQTCNDYQGLFAQELLLLENNYPNDVILEIPKIIQKEVSEFDSASYSQKLSAKACFEYCQLIARWNHPEEISNILGVYFKNDTLYLNALSDIRELKCIRYGHSLKIRPEAIKNCCTSFEDESIKQIFTSVCNEAFGRSVQTKALRLLCQLHGRRFEDAQNVVCDFDYDGQEYREKVLPALSEFIEAKQP